MGSVAQADTKTLLRVSGEEVVKSLNLRELGVSPGRLKQFFERGAASIDGDKCILNGFPCGRSETTPR